jgi:PTH1 family peptidyl-tRNA hydrolase
MTRHNAGALWVTHIAAKLGQNLKPEKKFHGLYAKITLKGHEVHLLCPTTFMNRSGLAVLALAGFYKLTPDTLLVAHDELDLPAGTVRLKKDGGHGGHNGLRDIVKCLGEVKDFPRVRLGIDHPGHKERVHGHVLGHLSDSERTNLKTLFNQLDAELETIVSGNWEGAMNRLHSLKPS